ncbi:MAG: hypothetical protein IJO46_03105, partial [Thermoguttaceae bacterium]|nr:hypothetical protein [Thermoguttaceae bacterium]
MATRPNKTITPWQLYEEWLSGLGPEERHFKEGDFMLEDLKYSAHIWNLREEITRNLKDNAPMYVLYPEVDASRSLAGLSGLYTGYKDLLETVITQEVSTSQFLGSYAGVISI